MSRIIGRKFIINETEKEKLRYIIFRQSEFSGVRVVTLVSLDNHFHLLLEVLDNDTMPPITVEEVLERLPNIYSAAKVKEYEKRLVTRIKSIGW